jgi:hypothetical protein
VDACLWLGSMSSAMAPMAMGTSPRPRQSRRHTHQTLPSAMRIAASAGVAVLQQKSDADAPRGRRPTSSSAWGIG